MPMRLDPAVQALVLVLELACAAMICGGSWRCLWTTLHELDSRARLHEHDAMMQQRVDRLLRRSWTPIAISHHWLSDRTIIATRLDGGHSQPCRNRNSIKVCMRATDTCGELETDTCTAAA